MTSSDTRQAGRWVCVQCRTPNALDADTCEGCGIGFAELLRGGESEPAVRAHRAVPAVREAFVLLGLFALWKVAGTVSVMSTASAFARGRWIWRLERSLHLPSELTVQHQVLGHPVVVRALDVFYLGAHVGGLAVFVAWLFWCHRDRYRRWRNAIVAFTGISLVIQLVSVAPPRLLPDLGFVDTATVYHQSAYDHIAPGLVDQLSSMPSIHVGWAVLIAVAVVSTSRSRWRWLVVAHPLLTTYAVVATANHFWLDAVVAVVLVALVLGVQTARTPAGGRSRSVRTADALPDEGSCR
jgi:hypothetical protein